MDKTLIASLVTLGAAIAVAAGVEVSADEQASLVELGAQAVAGLAGLVAVLRGVYLRAKNAAK